MTKIKLMNYPKGFLAIGVAILASVILLFGGFFLGVGMYLSPQNNLKKSDAIVAISGGDTDARVEEAVSLYKDGWSSVLIFSGAALDPNSPSNAATMRLQAIKSGVPANAIMIEEKAVNTKQNAANVNVILKARGYQRIILVTSPYHQRRANLTFQKQYRDLEIINHSAKDKAWRRSRWWGSPRSLWLSLSELQKVIFLKLGGQPT